MQWVRRLRHSLQNFKTGDLTGAQFYGIVFNEMSVSLSEMKQGRRERGRHVKQDYRIAAVDRALDILELLGRQRTEFGLPELSKAVGLPKATVFRYLSTLEERGYVRKSSDNDKYTLGLKILQLSNDMLGSVTLHEVALPHMRKLVARFQETVNLALLDEYEVVYVEILESPKAFKMSSQVGGREMPHATALGKAMLAFLPEEEVNEIIQTTGLPRRTPRTICTPSRFKEELEAIRQRGYAVDQEENEEGAHCVGVPIFDHRRKPIAAISISGPAIRILTNQIEHIGSALVEVSSDISHRLGYAAKR